MGTSALLIFEIFFQAIFNPQGTRILTAGSDKTARLWDPYTGDCVQASEFSFLFKINSPLRFGKASQCNKCVYIYPCVFHDCYTFFT